MLQLPSLDESLARLRSGDRVMLGRLLSAAESPLPDHRAYVSALLEKCTAHTNTRRIGITGVPGVGKSTFINVLGMQLLAKGHRVAVLAVDPSSRRSGGSILGDKTRMAELSAAQNAFVRPSPSGAYLGGVAAGTRTSVLLCEEAGYDTLLIETVGVGQSETSIEGLTDFLILLMLPGAGDELQGIKRGIMEVADAVIINKSDGSSLELARRAKAQYQSALRLFPPHPAGWNTPVELVSSTEKNGIENAEGILLEFFRHVRSTGYLAEKRKAQEVTALHEMLRELLVSSFYRNESLNRHLRELEEMVKAGKLPALTAAEKLFRMIRITF